MKSNAKVMVMMVAIVAGGCDKQDNPTKPPQPKLFETQQEALEKAKQVEGVIHDADERQRGLIDEQSR